nr:MAG TPA: hypothetical protein [Caudoviricetes sp.]DAT89182.1 MAG TPA: hypothetical protein [Caudoviricetes sp.]DAX54622.1 MAG TPA: hypothetical protein [Caudoviricetes sp.]
MVRNKQKLNKVVVIFRVKYIYYIYTLYTIYLFILSLFFMTL